MHPISVKGLLSVYVFLPLVLVFIFCDHFFFNGAGRHMLPRNPETLLWYTLLFNLPHIFTSFFSFADREYLAFYKWPLLFGLPLIAVLAFLLPAFNLISTVFMLVLYTLYHNISQQTGVTMSLMRYKSLSVQVWRFINILLGLYLYFLIYPPVAIPILQVYALPVLGTLLTISLALTISFVRHSKTREGKLYAFGTASIAGVGMIAFMTGYPFFVATTLRVVHDLTAFIFYITHDINRNREKMKNFLYATLLPSTKLFIVGIPLYAIFFTFIAQQGGTSLVLQAFFLISVTHFYIEGFMWKNGSIHRQQITFQF